MEEIREDKRRIDMADLSNPKHFKTALTSFIRFIYYNDYKLSREAVAEHLFPENDNAATGL